MAQKIQLSIDEPCHENWDKMTDADKGRFCNSCQKQVIDFSMMSDREIAQFFKKPSTGSVCGRFMRDQLDREIEIPKKRIPWFKYFMTVAFPAFLTSMKGKAQDSEHSIAKDSSARKGTVCKVDMNIRLGVIAFTEFDTPIKFKNPKLDEITGRVIDPDGNPIPNATIKIKNSRAEAVADENGYFLVKLKAKRRRVEIQASQDGFEDASFLITRKDYNPEMEIVLDYRVYMLGGLRVRRFKKSEVAKETVVTPATLKAYPNPAQRGKPLTIESLSDQEQTVQIEIRDLAGNLLASQKQAAIKGINRMQVNTDPKWSAGIIIVQLIDENRKQISTTKILLQ